MCEEETVQGFKIQQNGLIHKTTNSTVFLGEYNSHQAILKIYPSKYPSEQTVRAYQKDHQLTALLHSKYPNYFTNPLKFMNENNNLYSIKSAFGISLKQHQENEKQFTIEHFLKLAVQICQSLHYVHEENILHCDIKPQNMLYDEKKNICSIIDFESSVLVSLKNPSIPNNERGTYFYMSPEQSGRTSKQIDKTSDIYSLGISLFQLFTGEIPFKGQPNEVIYSHIAEKPPLMSSFRKDTPSYIEEVIQKMIKKSQSERYCSIIGAKKELEFILKNLNNQEELKKFKAGMYDVDDILSFENKLYGRDTEIQLFKEKINNIKDSKVTEMIMISGVSGIGKSSLIHEILSNKNESMILTGKFDQFLQSPFSAFIQILKKYFQLLSSESQENLKKEKDMILKALNKNGKVLTSLIKESEYILGEQEDLEELASEAEQQKRFIITLIDFFNVISGDKLLCLFVDDLQWADIPSLQLIRSLIQEPNSKMLLIGAYRDNEVSSTHPMVTILDPLIKERGFETINLKNLKMEDVEEMLKDTLDSSDVIDLSKLIYSKTNGNPFFIKEFIFNLYDKKLIKFNYQNEKWVWNLDEISKVKFSENVVEFMIEKVHEFSEETKKILNIASCIGVEFNLDLLSTLLQLTEEELYQGLLEVITKGWIFEIGNSFKFVHDRLQQASYEIYPNKQQVHFQIGSIFLEAATKKNEFEKYIFDIVNHLNSAGDYFKDKNQLIQLNLRASITALQSHAFDSAVNYSKIAKSLLPESSWKSDHKLTYKVLTMLAGNLCLVKNLDEASEIFEELLVNSITNLEKLEVATSYIILINITSNFKRGIELTYQILAEFDFSKHIATLDSISLGKWAKNLHEEISKFLLNKNSAQEFLDAIPEQSNEEITKFMGFIFQAVGQFSRTCQYETALTIWLLGVDLCIKEGYNKFAAPLCSSAAWMCQAYYESPGLRKLAIFTADLIDTIKDPQLNLYLTCYIIFNGIFSGSLEKAIKIAESGYTYALSIGEYQYGSMCKVVSTDIKLGNGCNYKRALHEVESSVYIINSTGFVVAGDMVEMFRTKCEIMIGRINSYQPKFVLPGLENIPFVRALNQCVKICCLYLLRDFDSAKEAIEKYQNEYKIESVGTFQHYEGLIYTILTYYSLPSPKQYLDEIKKYIDFFKVHNEINAEYFEPRLHFSEAIYQSILNEDNMATFIAFQKAIKSSEKFDFILALCYEYFAEFCHRTIEFQEYGNFLENEAYKKYKAMEVVCKYRHLNPTNYSMENTSSSSIDTNTISSTGGQTTTTMGTTSSGGVSIDLQTVLKSSETISEGLDKDRLLTQLNQIIAQNAGAEKGFIILKEKNKFIIKSEFSKEKLNINVEITDNSNILCTRIFNQCLNQHDIIIMKNALNQLPEDKYIQQNKVKSILCAPIIKGNKISGVLYLENNSMEGTFNKSRKFIFQHILSQVAIAIENITLFEDVKTINNAYARFLPSEFLNQLSKKDVRNIQPSESVEKKMTVMFSDIRNFTSITDKMNAKESFQFVNEILSKLAPCISSNHGFVDKFIGDCVMAIFPRCPLDGVKAGIQMLQELKILNKNKEIPICIGVGLSFGNVMLGTLGFEERLDATVISKTVNTASRMESLTKSFGVDMIITQEIYEEIKSEIKCNLLGSFYLKGQNKAKKLFEVVNQNQKFDNEKFQNGLKLFNQKRLLESFEIFSSLKNEKKICNFYSNVCELYQLIELPDDWKGEIRISKDGDPEPISMNNVSCSMKDQLVLIRKLMGNPEKFKQLIEVAKKIDQIDE